MARITRAALDVRDVICTNDGHARSDTGLAKISPVNIGSKFLTRNQSSRFSIDVDGQRLTACLSISHISQMSERRIAPCCKEFTLCLSAFDVVGFQVHEQDNTPFGVVDQHHTVNFATFNRLV